VRGYLQLALGVVRGQARAAARRVRGLDGGRQPVARVLRAGRVHAQAAVLAQQDQRALLLAAAAAPVPHRHHVRDLRLRRHHLPHHHITFKGASIFVQLNNIKRD
jgi:hypothetical protein